MKKLINDPKNVVTEMLEGFVALDDRLVLLADETIVLRRDVGTLAAAGTVALISGGGAGHEPAHAGYVGEGLLTAAVSGDVFSSPSTDAVLAAIRAVAGPAGVLLIVKNYTGDRLNFGLAADIARTEGLSVEMVVVDDDVALGAGGGAGRRGIAGTVLVHKVAGAAAAAGLPLAQVKAQAQAAIAATGTMGVGLTGCTVPGAETAGFTLGDGEIELGLGIHGEAGAERGALVDADTIVEQLVLRILADKAIGSGDEVAMLVNGLGGTPPMELGIVARRALHLLGERGVTVRRSWCGSFLTALDMQGASISLMKLDDQRLAWLDADARASGWVKGAVPSLAPARQPHPKAVGASEVSPGDTENPDAASWRAAISAATAAIRADAHRLTVLDQAVGDGDIGFSLVRGADALDDALKTAKLPDASSTLRLISQVLRRSIGGTSGPLYAIAALRAAEVLRQAPEVSPAIWSQALSAACAGMSELGGARRGDRTMLDALIPAAEALADAVTGGAAADDALADAVTAARKGASATAMMAPRKGRSSYLVGRTDGHSDPGAEAVVTWLDALRQELARQPRKDRS